MEAAGSCCPSLGRLTHLLWPTSWRISLCHCSTHTQKAKIRVKVSKKHRNTQTALPKPKPKKSAEEERMVGCKREGERGEARKGWGEKQKHKALFWKELHEGSTRVWVWTQGLSVKKQRAELGR